MSNLAYSVALTFTRGIGRTRTTMAYAPTLESVETFVGEIQQLSDAAIAKISFVTTELTGNTENPNPGTFGLSSYAKIKLRRNPYDPHATNNYREVHIICPKIDIVEAVEGQGYRVKQNIGEGIAAAYSEMTGLTYEFKGGWVCGGFPNDWDGESGG